MLRDSDLPLKATYCAFRDSRNGRPQRLWRRVRGRLNRSIEGHWTDGFFTERVAEVPEFLCRVARTNPTTPILDVGCTDSFMPAHYLAMGYEVHGLDLRDPGIDAPGFRFIRGDAARLEPEQQYDVITLLSVLEHCGLEHYGGEAAATDARVIRNLRRFLTPRGRFICSVPFGQPAEFEWWRIYDEGRLISVFEALEEVRCFRSAAGAWYPCEQAEAAVIETTGWPPGAVIVFESGAAAADR